jgi:prevent-host-death family protein
MYDSTDDHKAGHVSVSEARETFAELVNRAAYGHERVLVARRGRPVAAIVPIEDVEFIERMEDELDLRAALEALADPENAIPIPWEQLEAELDRK